MNIQDLLQNTNSNIKLELSIDDLKVLVHTIMDNKAKYEQSLDMLSSKQVMAIFHITKNTLTQWIKLRIINPTKINGIYFFSKKEVKEVINNNKIA